MYNSVYIIYKHTRLIYARYVAAAATSLLCAFLLIPRYPCPCLLLLLVLLEPVSRRPLVAAH